MKQSQPVMFVFLGYSLVAACADNLEVPPTNIIPVAVARVLDDDRPRTMFTFSGASLELTLDASHSYDQDGTIRGYRWLSATRRTDLEPSTAESEDAGLSDGAGFGRWVPEGEPKDWPDDVERPSVRLPSPGNYAFSLWVIDDRGKVSEPSTLEVQVVPGPVP